MKIRSEVKKAMNQLYIKELRKGQNQIINAILDGHDTFVIAPTSYGKSLVYQVPAIIQNDALTIVIEPLIALMHDQAAKLRSLGIAAEYLDSTLSCDAFDETVAGLQNGDIQILFIAPERLETGILTLAAQHNRIGMIVVDEAHCVITWGYTFREAYLAIGTYIEELDYHPVIVALSATALPEDRPRIMELLEMHHVKCFERSLYRSNLVFMKKAVASRKEKQNALKKYMKRYHTHTSVIFCTTKHDAEEIAKFLKNLYPNDVAVYHSKKKKLEHEMLSGKKHIIVATSALSMGVDIRNVDLVIHFNMPLSMADYYQMAGRAGREGQQARSILLYDSKDYYTNRCLLEDISDKEARKAAYRRLDNMKEFCEDTKYCMVQSILWALGDTHQKKCRYCTNCQKGR